MAQASDRALDPHEIAQELDVSVQEVVGGVSQLESMGLMLCLEEEDEPPLLLNAGSQFLDVSGEVSGEILHFLPHAIDDLNTREALHAAGTTLVDEFRAQHVAGDPVEHARSLVPPAFVAVVDLRLAVQLFAAAVALMVRLSDGAPAGCVAEEIIAVRLLDEADAYLEARAENDELGDSELADASTALRTIFELFQDDDVLNLFEMQEPADAAVAGHDPINQQMGVADQRSENWFTPFGGTSATGYLSAPTDP